MTNSKDSKKKRLNKIFYFNGLNSIKRASKKKSPEKVPTVNLKKYCNSNI